VSTVADFVVFPAIDLREGQVVRLRQGDPAQQTIYFSDPRAAAERWLAAGTEWLHVVNLDGAFGEAADANLAALGKIMEVGAKVQFGGGLRALDAIEHALDLGVSRVVLGTVAVTQPEMVDAALAMFTPERVAVGVDARDGMVQVRGWREGSAYTTVQLGERLQMQGVRLVIFTDITRDGVGTGLNLAATVALAEQTGLQVIASGGVHTAADVLAARDAGLGGAIIGRALYEGTIELADLLAKIVHNET